MPIFAKHAFGLDISDASVEAMVLAGTPKKPKIESYARVELREGVVENGVIHDADALLASLLELSNAAQPKPIRTPYVILSLPESRVLLGHVTVPKEKDSARLRAAVLGRAQEVIPYEPEEVVADFHVVGDTPDNLEALFVAVDRTLVAGYRSVLDRAYLKPLAFDLESAALARSLARHEPGPVGILDLGARKTTFSVVELGNIQRSDTFPVGGESFTASLASRLRVAKPKAELLKRTAGLDPQREKGRVLHVLQSPVGKLVGQIAAARKAWEEASGRRVGKVILAGGGSLLPRLPEYVGENLGIPAEIGDPFLDLKREDVDLGSEESVLFATVTGLAVRGISPNPERAGVNLMGDGVFEPKKTRVATKPVVAPKGTSAKAAGAVPPTPDVASAFDVPVRVVKGKRKAGKVAVEKPEEPMPPTPIDEPKLPEPPPILPPVPPQPEPPKSPPSPPKQSEMPPMPRRRFAIFVLIIIVALAVLGIFLWQSFRPATNTNLATTNANVSLAPDTVPLAFTATFSSDVSKQTGGVLPARALTTTLELSKEGSVTGSKTENAAATGRVTITSTWSFEQPLVATTRLLSKEDVLFRLKDAVTVPANGSVDADVYADVPGPSGEIGPTTFTIPGLNVTKQTLITAKSETKMTGGSRTVGTVTQADVDAIVAQLEVEFSTKGTAALASKLDSGEVFVTDPVVSDRKTQSVKPGIGTETSAITVTERRDLTLFAVKQSDLEQLAKTAFSQTAPNGVLFDAYTLAAFTYSVTNYDSSTQTSTVNVMVEAENKTS